MTALYDDTHPKMEALQIQLWRQASPTQKIKQIYCWAKSLHVKCIAKRTNKMVMQNECVPYPIRLPLSSRPTPPLSSSTKQNNPRENNFANNPSHIPLHCPRNARYRLSTRTHPWYALGTPHHGGQISGQAPHPYARCQRRVRLYPSAFRLNCGHSGRASASRVARLGHKGDLGSRRVLRHRRLG